MPTTRMTMPTTSRRPPAGLGSWSADGRKALESSPGYFLWWYTVKSVGLVLTFGTAAYLLGRAHGREGR